MKSATKSTVLIHNIETHIDQLLDNYHQAVREWNGKAIQNFLSDDCLYLGTDPLDVFDKDNIRNAMDQVAYAVDNIHYEITKRVIKVSSDGKSVVSIEEFFEPKWCKSMSLRVDLHWRLVNDEWKIFVGNWSFIPEDKFIPIIDKAVLSSKQHHN